MVIFKVIEGVSLYHFGVIDFIQQWASETGHPHHLICIHNINPCERYPWPNLEQLPTTTFLGDARSYLHDYFVGDPQYLFGIFIGRDTAERLRIWRDLAMKWPDQILSSHLTGSRCSISTLIQEQLDFYQDQDINEVISWYDNFEQLSLDGLEYSDQYAIERIQSLGPHYTKFGVEVVAETMCHGATFWITEKTARPIAYHKPFVIFASPHFLKNLRRMGFRTFHELWDEGYDDFEGLPRWQAMMTVLQYISNNPGILVQALPIIKHNAELIRSHSWTTNNFLER